MSGPALAQENDWEIRFPSWFFHFAPLALALFCLTLSLGDYSVFRSFREKGPGTTLSLVLMAVCLVLSLAALRNAALDRARRQVAAVLSLLAVGAMGDEAYQWHEAFGRFAQHSVHLLRPIFLLYADDVLVLLASLAGAALLAYLLHRTTREAGMGPYLACVVVLAAAHGLLDIISHKDYIIRMVWPDLPRIESLSLEQRLGFFEEWCKIWCEWFVILFLARYYARQKGSLLWSVELCLGGLLATAGLWELSDPASGVPYLTVGSPMHILRNYPALVSFCWVGWAWGVMAWICFGHDRARRALAGLLFLAPVSLLAARVWDAASLGRAIRTLADGILPNAFYQGDAARNTFLLVVLVLPGLALGVAAAWLLDHLRGRARTVLVLALAGGAALDVRWASPVLPLLEAGGVLLLAATLLVLERERWGALPLLLLVVVSSLASNPLWMVAATTWMVFSWIQGSAAEVRCHPGASSALALTHLLVSLLILAAASPPRIPNHRYRDRRPEFFAQGYEPLPGLAFEPPEEVR